jgi:hypothetical protein
LLGIARKGFLDRDAPCQKSVSPRASGFPAQYKLAVRKIEGRTRSTSAKYLKSPLEHVVIWSEEEKVWFVDLKDANDGVR